MKLNEIEYKFFYWGPLVMDVELEDETISLLLEKGKESQKKHLDARKKLAAVINKAYDFEEVEWFYPIFNPYVNGYIEAVCDWKKNAFKNSPIEWELHGLWINYQKANEYNPPHNHSGILSGVLYLKIPEYLLSKKTEGRDGSITFIGNDTAAEGMISDSILTISPKVGDIFLFSSTLKHQVYPFRTVDGKGIRRSMSFNLSERVR